MVFCALMKFASLLLVAAGLLAGCQSASEPPAPSTEEKPEAAASAMESPSSSSPSQPAASEPAETSADQVTPGMSMADVKKIKGAPKDTKHDHGPDNSELDFWIYDDVTVQFKDGKVVK